jgi:lysozyme
MQTSAKGKNFIAAREGVVTRAYRDAGGTWTIGVGHTAAAGAPIPVQGMTISRARAFQILAADLARCERRVTAALPVLAQHEFDGAVSFDFNTGAIDRAGWVARFRDGDSPGAREGLMKWTKAGGRVVAGLVERRRAEARLIFDGDYGEASAATGVADVQEQLARLGFDPGPVDGLAGQRTKAAIRAYQASHPDLVVDGVAGPATRAALARDIAARDRQLDTGIGGLVGLLLAWLASLLGGINLGLVVAGVTVFLAGAAALFFAWRYRAEIARLLFSKGDQP